MDLKLTPDEIGTIVSFIVPGYFAIRAYTLVHTKVDKEFSKVAVESIAYSLLITGFYNAFWMHIILRNSHDKVLYPTSVKYAVPLLIISLVTGYLWGKARKGRWIASVSSWLKLPSPSDDFMADVFNSLYKDEYVTVRLRDGKIFRGVRAKISAYRVDEDQMCTFDYVHWYRKKDKTWKVHVGTLILNMKDVAYMETARKLPK